MIKDIIVNLSVDEKAGPASDYAISVAKAFDAHVTGLAFAYDAIIPASGGGYIAADVIELQQRETAARTKAAIDGFRAAVSRAGVAAETFSLSVSFSDAAAQFGRAARRFDLSVVGQAAPESDAADGFIAEAALFDSGRPVIVVPYIQKAPMKLDRVMVCWDGSRAAARATGDAVPILMRAGRVDVVIVADEEGKEAEVEGADMARHLARHGVQVEVERTVSGDIDIAEVLLSRAADTDADLVVMGGYGHSRLREFVLGGVTRSMLRSMTVPVLMSH